jgi:hypothetical protein
LETSHKAGIRTKLVKESEEDGSVEDSVDLVELQLTPKVQRMKIVTMKSRTAPGEILALPNEEDKHKTNRS